MRRLNRYVEEKAPWQLAKDPEKADELQTVLRSLAEGLRVVTVLLTPYIPESAEKLLDAARRAGDRAGRRALRRPPRRADREQARAPLPQAGVIDSHTHLDRGPAPEAELVAQAADEGVTRILTIGMDAESRRKALQAAETYAEVYAAIGHHPNEATGYTDAITEELSELAQHPQCLAIGETGPRRLPRLRAPRKTRNAPSTRRSSSRTSCRSR